MIWDIQKSFNFLLITFSILTIVLQIVNTTEQDNYVFKSGSTTRIKVERLRYTWTIENFSLYNLKVGKALNSPIFSSKANTSCKYELTVFLNGYNYSFTDYVSLFLSPMSCPVNFEYKLGILNSQLKEVNTYSSVFIFKGGRSASLGSVDLPKFINQQFLLNQTNGILSHDKLTIFCEINTTVGVESTSEVFEQSQMKPSHLGQDLAYLFENHNFTDVTLSVGGKEFQVLKSILAARSSIFKTIFEQDVNEAKITKIKVTDLDQEVVKEMLRYIYTEKVLNLEYLAPALLVAAEKYELKGLKALCESSMVENISIENAAEFYVLGDTYSAVDLKTQVKHFIAAHVSSVVRTPGFKSMMQTYPHLVEEAFDELDDLLAISCINKN